MQDMSAIIAGQRGFFATGRTLDAAFRHRELSKLAKWVADNEELIASALFQDLGKSAFEAGMCETYLVKEELRYMLKHVRSWAKGRWARPSLMQLPARCRVLYEPYGVALILSPWNYPFLLSLSPLIGAMAAGNCVVLKPSNDSPATSALIARMAKDLFDPDYITVILGGRAEITGLLDEKFDTIFFTGSTQVGRVVMTAAAKHLTPVTLELGGKSPCIVDETANLALAARRIVWGKLINAGQTCIAPDHLYAHESVADQLIGHMKDAIREFFGSEPLTNPQYPKIINDKHFFRLLGLLQGTPLLCGGASNQETRKIAPTLVHLSDPLHPLMREEIFGPILPILTYRSFDKLLLDQRAMPHPLALYLFTRDPKRKRRVLRELPFGGGCVNDTVLHIASTHMPFGGVGDSGIGRYHGRDSLLAFSHQKSMVSRGLLDLPVRFPPYGKGSFPK